MSIHSRIALLLITLALISPTTARAADAALRAQDLRCEYRTEADNIDAARPRLSWTLASTERGQKQTAFHVLLASSSQNLAQDNGDLWDSGKVVSSESMQIACAGKALASLQRCYWKVRIWDRDDRVGAWSESTRWTMGMLRPQDWRGKWIERGNGAAATQPTAVMPWFRKEFTVAKPLTRATIAICGLGQFELRLNGGKVGVDEMQPGWTNYRTSCLYLMYDVTRQVKKGGNAIGVMLGNGMYNCVGGRYSKFKGTFGAPKLIAQIQIDYTDGTSETVATDASWKTGDSPVTFSSIFGGEDEDARLNTPGWDQAAFNDSSWQAASETTGPGGALAGSTRAAPPIRVERVLKPVKITQPKPGVYVYDMGQNCSQIPQLLMKGTAGAKVRIEASELLNADGTISPRSAGNTRDKTYCVYTLRGGGDESWGPRFFYIGCRYWQVEGVVPAGEAGAGGDASKPVLLNFEGRVVTSSSPVVGEFACSNDLFTRTAELITWALRSNMMSVLTDCPHRERLGWLEQVHLVGPSMMYGFDVAVLQSKSCNDMAEAQRPDGLVPDIAPEFVKFNGGFLDSPEWGSAALLVPWQLYETYGDEQVLRDRYDTMKRYVQYLGSKSNNHLLDFGLGDWYDIGPKPPGASQLTPKGLTATAFYARDAQVLASVARRLGRTDDAEKYTALASAIAASFNAKYYDASKHSYSTGSQAADAIPLVFELAPAGDRAAVLESLVKDIRGRDNALTAGDVGYRYVLRALAAGGRSDVIFDMNSRDDRPGYGMMLKKGATSLTEAWDARASSSHNHFMLGHIMEWFYADLAGIQREPEVPGWSRIVIKPNVVGDVTWTKATYNSIRGPIVSDWKRQGGTFTLNLTIPPGATAMVHVPASSEEAVSEGGKSGSQAEGVKFVRAENGAVVYAVPSGSYSFTAK